jgi:hypothetical protein
VKRLLGLVVAVSALGQPPRTWVPHRAPLAPNLLYALPLGSVKPAGWLKQQLRIQADGLSGHLDEIWPDVGSNSAWLGGTGEGWERGPYYLDGLLPLAHLLDDPVLVAKARKYVNWTLDRQRADGFLGPEKNSGNSGNANRDWWPNMVMLKALTQFQEATGDPRVVPVLEKYFAYQAKELAGNPLREWARYRWGDELVSIIWLYDRNGDPKLLDLARQLAGQGFDWKELFADYPFRGKTVKANADMRTHGVNNAMALKTDALWSMISGHANPDASKAMLTTLDRYHGLPNGAFAADEHLAGLDPSQGTELCAVVEEMYSLEQLVQVSDEPIFAHRLERLAFNALPGAFSKDMWAHQYDQQPNQVLVSNAPRDWTTNGPMSNVFGLEPNFGCCTANMHQGWPKFAASLWMATADNGLAAVEYSPSEVRTVAGGTPVHISEETSFPFDETITLRIDPEKAAAFPLRLRIPGWTTDALVRVNGAAQRNVQPGTYFTIRREWRAGDTIAIRFPMPVMVSRGYRNAAVVTRGPLLYSLSIGEKWKKLTDREKASDWEVYPSTHWNYGLYISKSDPQSSFSLVMRKMGEQPFSPEGTPLALSAKGERLGEWKLVDSSAGPVPESPVKARGGTPAEVVLIPYGAAKLRISEFPVIDRK